MSSIKTINDFDVKGKTALCRVDLNVPMKQGKVEDSTRIKRLLPTIENLISRGAKVVLLSHFGRPKGKFILEMSLAPIVDAVKEITGRNVHFAVDCIGQDAKQAVDNLDQQDILVLENLRFHEGEEQNCLAFAKKLSSLGDIYVNDTFSCSHRKHASIAGIANYLPAAAGLLLYEEIEQLDKILSNPKAPIAAIVGGSKISTKLDLLYALIKQTDLLMIGGGMANTFLKAKGYDIGKSICEKDLVKKANEIMQQAKEENCEIVLPEYVVISKELKEKSKCKVVAVDKVPADYMILDIGPMALADVTHKLKNIRTLIWNGPLGAFEYSPYGVGTISLARSVAAYTEEGSLVSIAGGGDVVAALGCAGLSDSFTYISTAGGAFLKWVEGKDLVGIDILRDNQKFSMSS